METSNIQRILIAIGACIFVIVFVNIINQFYAKSFNLKYNDKIIVTKGFYKGFRGTVWRPKSLTVIKVNLEEVGLVDVKTKHLKKNDFDERFEKFIKR